MKYKILLISLFYSTLFFSQTDNGIVKYECSLNTYKLEMFLKKNDSIKKKLMFTQRIIDETDPVLFTLKFNENESTFSMDEELEPDNKLNLIKMIFKDGFYYINKKEGVSLRRIDTFGDQFLVDISKRNWELSNISKKIGKYVCFKATIKNEEENGYIEAWYAPKLNNLITPLGFNGLPGAILELSKKEGKYTFEFKATDIKYKKKEIKIKKPTKGKKVTQEEFIKIGKGAMEGLKNR